MAHLENLEVRLENNLNSAWRDVDVDHFQKEAEVGEEADHGGVTSI